MARLARVAVAEVAYHLTQRGNARQYLLDSDAERTVYLDLLVGVDTSKRPSTSLGYLTQHGQNKPG